MAEAEPPVEVVAGALIDAAGRVLIADRPPDKPMAGRWEFPGGKLRSGESARDGLRRELIEELGIEPARCKPLLTVRYHYAGAAREVRIDCWRVESWRGEPRALDGQQLRWCTREELAQADILEADRAIVTALILPQLLAAARAGAPRAIERARTGWLIAPGEPAPAAAAEDLLIHIDPEPASGAAAALYSAAGRFRTAPSRDLPAGLLVNDAAQARAGIEVGADYLVVPDRSVGIEALEGIAAAGLPWYLDVTRPGVVGEPAPTGRLWWPASGSRHE
jgi:mutator protein MutT